MFQNERTALVTECKLKFCLLTRKLHRAPLMNTANRASATHLTASTLWKNPSNIFVYREQCLGKQSRRCSRVLHNQHYNVSTSHYYHCYVNSPVRALNCITLIHNFNCESLSQQFMEKWFCIQLLYLLSLSLASYSLPLSSSVPLYMSNPDEQMGGGEKKNGHARLLRCYNTVNQSPPPSLTSYPFPIPSCPFLFCLLISVCSPSRRLSSVLMLAFLALRVLSVSPAVRDQFWHSHMIKALRYLGLKPALRIAASSESWASFEGRSEPSTIKAVQDWSGLINKENTYMNLGCKRHNSLYLKDMLTHALSYKSKTPTVTHVARPHASTLSSIPFTSSIAPRNTNETWLVYKPSWIYVVLLSQCHTVLEMSVDYWL